MPPQKISVDPQSFHTFGALLRYLRRREQLTQRDLGIGVGYSEGHINRFEKDRRAPDPATVAALFIPVLNLGHDSDLAARLIELAGAGQTLPPEGTGPSSGPRSAGAQPLLEHTIFPEAIPPTPPYEITRVKMVAVLERALNNERRVLLCGLPGMGKTTLASHIAREFARRMPVFWLTLTDGITASADGLVRQMAAFLVAHGREEARPLVALSPARSGGNLPLDLQISLLCTALSRGPALLCLDNAELIQRDEACLQILRHLAAATPAFILLNSRESLSLPAFTEITLNGFEPEEGRTFVEAVFPRVDPDPNVAISLRQVEKLVAKTDGSPMLLHLAVGKLLNERADPDLWINHLETQPQVVAYLLETVQKQLSPAGWRLLLLLAVLQKPVNLYDRDLVELARTLGDIDPISLAIAELQRRYLIINAAYAQLHPLVGDFVRQALNAEGVLRQRLHRLAADWFRDAGQDPLSAAYHYGSADLLEQAVDAIEENEHMLISRGEALPAVSLLDDVQARIKRQRLSDTDLLRRLLVERAVLLNGTLRVNEGEANLRLAIELTTTPALRAYTIYRLAELRISRSYFAEALQLIQAAKADLAPQDLLLRARLTVLKSVALESTGQVEQALLAAHASLALADQMSGIPAALVEEIRARALMELANIARMKRDLSAAMEWAQQALAAARGVRQLRLMNLSLMFIGGLIYDQGDPDSAFRYRSEALEGLLEIGDVHSAAYLLTQLADIHHMRLEIDLALEKVRRAVQTLRIVGDIRALAAAQSIEVTCLLCKNEVAEARQVIDQLLKTAEGKGGTERLWGYRLKKLAMVQLVQGETQAAIATLQRASELPATQAHPMMSFELHTALAFAHTVAGEMAEAQHHLSVVSPTESVSRWVEFDRELVEGYFALARGDVAAARAILERNRPRAEKYPLYRRNFADLESAIDQLSPPAGYPRLLWVCCAS